MGLHIIITGNPVDGFNYYGPFATFEEADKNTIGVNLNQGIADQKLFNASQMQWLINGGHYD